MNSLVFYIGLGSNLGDRVTTLHAGITDLQIVLMQKLGVMEFCVAPWYESAPIGEGASGGAYLNTVAQGAMRINTPETSNQQDASSPSDLLIQPARVLLQLLHQIESQYGRVRDEGARNQARTLDLDLLLFGNLICDAPDLTLPHPRMHERAFILKPLLDLAPDIEIPKKGKARNYLSQVQRQNLSVFGHARLGRSGPTGAGL